MPILRILLLLTFYSHTAIALTPPNGRDICQIEGKVIALSPGEGTDESMHKVAITEVTIAITKRTLAIKNTNGDVSRCNKKLLADESDVFQLCDHTELKTGDIISAKEGTSLGGGRYCIYDIKKLGL